MKATVKLTLSREQMSRATENSNLRHRGQQKIYSMLLSKARNIRKKKGGRSSPLLRTQSAFEAKPKKRTSNDGNAKKEDVNNFLEDVTDTIVDDMGEELNRVDADRAGGGF